MRTLMIVLTVLTVLCLQNYAHADYATTPNPYPNQPNYNYPNYPQYPHYVAYTYPAPVAGYPYYPGAGVVTCFAQGLMNGALFYGIGYNVYAAQQWAVYACNTSGQYCQLTGCRY